MVSGIAALMLLAGLGAGLVLIAGGIVLLVLGLRRRDDSTSRPFLALGVGLLIIGSIVLLPSLFLVARMITGLG